MNFNKAGFKVEMAVGEYIIVLADVNTVNILFICTLSTKLIC